MQSHHLQAQVQIQPLPVSSVNGTDTAAAAFAPIPNGITTQRTNQTCQSSPISVDELLAARGALLRAHRKAACWLFFNEVGIRPAAMCGAEETLLACKICRPHVTDTASWEAVRGARGGLVRYSSTSGTSAMRTHVRNVHRAEAEAIDRVLAASDSNEQVTTTAVVTVPSPQSATLVHSPEHSHVRKRTLATLASSNPHLTTSSKKRRGDVKSEILLSIQSIEASMAGLYASVENLKSRIQALL